jgi:serine/threonine protein kinase
MSKQPVTKDPFDFSKVLPARSTLIRPSPLGTPNPFAGTPNPFAGRPNTFARRPNTFAVNPNIFAVNPNPFAVDLNPFAANPDTFAANPNTFAVNPNPFETLDSSFEPYDLDHFELHDSDFLEHPGRDPLWLFSSGEPPKLSRPISSHYSFETALPRLKVADASTFSKPVDYRVSTATPLTAEGLASTFKDWSGRGSHVDFLPEEVIPLKEGRFLGHGIMGGVYETAIGDYTFAWKRQFCRRKITDVERKEIEILKKLSHQHIVQLVGTYTHRQFLGLLLHPVAVCDLATFLDDFESICNGKDIESEQKERLHQLGLLYEPRRDFRSTGSTYICSKIGCLTSAVEYLHGQKIRHKDLKPANILLSAEGIWLTDFGTATDFSLLSSSSTEGCERGTPKYFAPEVAAYAPSGRGADIFSLGCILLELCAISLFGTLQPLRDLRPAPDKSFHANLDMTNHWLSAFASSKSAQLQHLLLEIGRMLAKTPGARPSAAEICIHMGLLDGFVTEHNVSLFGSCCTGSRKLISDYEEKLKADGLRFQQEFQKLQREQDFIVRGMQARIAFLEASNQALSIHLSRNSKPYSEL